MIQLFKIEHQQKNWKNQQKIGHINKATQYEELEINNKMTTCKDKDKQTWCAYDVKVEEKTLNTSENK